MSAEQSKALVRRAFAIFSHEDQAPTSSVLAETFQSHEPDDIIRGLAGVTMLRAAFPDVRYSIEGPLLVDGDYVVTRWRAQGTHSGSMLGLPPTGKQVSWTGMTIWRIEGERIVEAWVSRDTLGILQQIGALPAL